MAIALPGRLMVGSRPFIRCVPGPSFVSLRFRSNCPLTMQSRDDRAVAKKHQHALLTSACTGV